MLWKGGVEFGIEAVSIGWGLFAPKWLSLSLNVCQHTSLCSCAHTPLCGLQTIAFLKAYASLPSLRDLVQELATVAVALWTSLLLLDSIPPGHAPSPVLWGSPVFFGAGYCMARGVPCLWGDWVWLALPLGHVARMGSGVRMHLSVPCWESRFGAGCGVQGPVPAERWS